MTLARVRLSPHRFNTSTNPVDTICNPDRLTYHSARRLAGPQSWLPQRQIDLRVAAVEAGFKAAGIE
jgi:hypothetical protein